MIRADFGSLTVAKTAFKWYTKRMSLLIHTRSQRIEIVKLLTGFGSRSLIVAAAVCTAIAFVPAPAHAASLTACPAFTNQVNDSVSRFDTICGLSCPNWVEAGGIACEPPEVVGLNTSGFALDPLGASGCQSDPATCGDKMNDIMERTGDESGEGGGSGDSGDRFSDILKNPNYGKDIVDAEKSPLIAPPDDVDGETVVTTNDPSNPNNDNVIQYKKVCKLWTNDTIWADDEHTVLKPGVPADLQDIVAAGGYVTPTQSCLVFRADDASAQAFAARRRSRARSLLSPFSQRLSAAEKNVSFTLKFKSVQRVAGTEGRPKVRMACGLTPFVVLSSVLVKDPSNPSRDLTIGRAAGRICRVVVFHVTNIVPKLSAKEKLLVRKGFGVITFKLVGLPSKGSREVPGVLPYGRIKILGGGSKPMNANSGGYVLTDKSGIAKWIGVIPKRGIYHVSGSWPFYKNQTSNFELKSTIKPKPKPRKKK